MNDDTDAAASTQAARFSPLRVPPGVNSDSISWVVMPVILSRLPPSEASTS